MRSALLCGPLSEPSEVADAMAQIENNAEDSINVEITALDQRMLLFPRLFATERVCKTILPTIKPVKRTLMAVVQVKKMVLAGIGAIKFQKDGDNVKSLIMSKMEKTEYLRDSIQCLPLEWIIDTHKHMPRTEYQEG